MPSSENALCEECEKLYTIERDKRCRFCGFPYRYCICRVLGDGREYSLIHVSGYDVKREAVSKRMVLHIKDDRLKELLDRMAFDMAETFRFRKNLELSEERTADAHTVFDCNSENTLVTWVCRSQKAYRRAGHDQSRELAMRVSKELGFETFEAFANIGGTAQKTLNSKNRRKNAESAQKLIADSDGFKDKNIIIIDDIVTTGASIGACADRLISAGANKVIALTFAKTD